MSFADCGGGEDGSAVCMARRSTEPRGGEENGAGTTREPGYDAELLESPDDVRECDLVPALPETVFSPGLLRILERGGADGELGAAFPDTLPVDREGESERVGGDMVRAADVAWCRRVGGAVAIALALARLAAIAAATLLFFIAGVVGCTAGRSCWLGHALSNCLRFAPSCASRTTRPRSFHKPSKDQNAARAF